MAWSETEIKKILSDALKYDSKNRTLERYLKNNDFKEMQKYLNTISPGASAAFIYALYITGTSEEELLADFTTIPPMFLANTPVKSFKIPNFITMIESVAFYLCTELKSIYIPKSVVYIGSAAFTMCPDLVIEYDGTEEEWNKIKIERTALPSVYQVIFLKD